MNDGIRVQASREARRLLTRRNRARLLRWATHAGALVPLLLLLWLFPTDQLGPEPIREITLRTGKTALILLLLSLACTPVNIILGWKQVLPLRRPLGLYAFLYVSLHLLTFLWLDYGWNVALIQEALFEKRYALVGLASFLILLPLAATSTRWAMRRLGKNWKRLHRWVYAAAGLAVLHYFWLVKQAYAQPILFALILGGLLLVRFTAVRQRLRRGRRLLGRWMATVRQRVVGLASSS